MSYLEKSTETTSPLQEGVWYSVPLYPFEMLVPNRRKDKIATHYLPVFLPAHEDKKLFNFPYVHYHFDLRFIHNNELYFIFRHYFLIPKEIFGKNLALSNGETSSDYRLYNGWLIKDAGSSGVKPFSQEVFNSWRQALVNNFFLIHTPYNGYSYKEIRWKDRMCYFPNQTPTNISLHKTLQKKNFCKKPIKFCGKCPHKGVNLNSVPEINGERVCPAHGGRWKIKDGNICLSNLVDETPREE